MPELPEVETMKSILTPSKNKKIINVYTSNKNLRIPINSNLKELVLNTTIVDISRKAKYLIISLNNNVSIIGHAGMSGNFFLEQDKTEIKKHDHVILYLDDNYSIVYNDPRRFGVIYALASQEISNSQFFKDIALDAIDENFTAKYLITKIKNVKTNIKTALLNQKIVAGIGNIYACEALYEAKIHPIRKANSITLQESEILVEKIKSILFKSIELGGSTLKDYKPNGKTGYFQNYFSVYGKEGDDCPNCHGKKCIKKIIQNGRSTFYCSNIQK